MLEYFAMGTKQETRLLSEIDPKVAKATARRRINAERDLHHNRERALRLSAEKGHIDFWVKPISADPKSARTVFIIDPEVSGNYYYFATAATDNAVANIKNPNKPFDLIVSERQNRNINNPTDVAKSLAEFLKEFFPYAGETSFALFRSMGSFHNDIALIRYLHPEEFISNVTEMPQDKAGK